MEEVVASCIDSAGQSTGFIVLLPASDFFLRWAPLALVLTFGLQSLRNKNVVDILALLALGKRTCWTLCVGILYNRLECGVAWASEGVLV